MFAVIETGDLLTIGLVVGFILVALVIRWVLMPRPILVDARSKVLGWATDDSIDSERIDTVRYECTGSPCSSQELNDPFCLVTTIATTGLVNGHAIVQHIEQLTIRATGTTLTEGLDEISEMQERALRQILQMAESDRLHAPAYLRTEVSLIGFGKYDEYYREFAIFRHLLDDVDRESLAGSRTDEN